MGYWVESYWLSCAPYSGVDTGKIKVCSAVTKQGREIVALVEMLDWVTNNHASTAFQAKRSPEFLSMLQASLTEEGQDWVASLSLPSGTDTGEDSGDGNESPISYFRKIRSFKKPVWVQNIEERAVRGVRFKWGPVE